LGLVFFIFRNLQKSKETSRIILTQKHEIEHEKQKSEELLYNTLPKKIVSEIKMHGKSAPIHHKQASILFADFVGFTKISSETSPENLILNLNTHFSCFDSLMVEYNLEKLKTIGDCYMCAGGIPEYSNTHVFDTILAGLAILDYFEQNKPRWEKKNMPIWEIRIGAHTGPVVAGVVGFKKLVYDVWGDTVNIASRMESNGIPGKMNVSQDIYTIIKPYFDCEARGEIEVKNRGSMQMYFVKGLLSNYQSGGNKNIPNAAFMKLIKETLA
jgi:adenylate cyclase